MIFVSIRVHSWFCIFFSCISCVSWFNPFVYIRVHSWFWFFFSCVSCPFVVLVFLFVYFVCFVFKPFAPIRGSSTSFSENNSKNKPPPMFF